MIVIAVHGVLATATILLVLLAAVGGAWSGCGGAGLLLVQPGNALRAAAGPPGAQPWPAAPAGRQQPGQPGGMCQQLGSAVLARHRHNGPDPAAWQGKPFPRPVGGRASWHCAHSPIFSLRGLGSHFRADPPALTLTRTWYRVHNWRRICHCGLCAARRSRRRVPGGGLGH